MKAPSRLILVALSLASTLQCAWSIRTTRHAMSKTSSSALLLRATPVVTDSSKTSSSWVRGDRSEALLNMDGTKCMNLDDGKLVQPKFAANDSKTNIDRWNQVFDTGMMDYGEDSKCNFGYSSLQVAGVDDKTALASTGVSWCSKGQHFCTCLSSPRSKKGSSGSVGAVEASSKVIALFIAAGVLGLLTAIVFFGLDCLNTEQQMDFFVEEGGCCRKTGQKWPWILYVFGILFVIMLSAGAGLVATHPANKFFIGCGPDRLHEHVPTVHDIDGDDYAYDEDAYAYDEEGTAI